MPLTLLAALDRLAKAKGYETPALILARMPDPKPVLPWWVRI